MRWETEAGSWNKQYEKVADEFMQACNKYVEEMRQLGLKEYVIEEHIVSLASGNTKR